MDDSEILLELVKLGVLKAREMSWHLIDHEGDVVAVFTDASLAVRDWQVAGVVMEKATNKPNWLPMEIDRKISSEVMHRCWIERVHSGTECEHYHARNESLPRAIIETCVLACDFEE